MDILPGLVEKMLEPRCHNGYIDVIYGVSTTKRLTQKHIGEERADRFTLIASMMYCDC